MSPPPSHEQNPLMMGKHEEKFDAGSGYSDFFMLLNKC